MKSDSRIELLLGSAAIKGDRKALYDLWSVHPDHMATKHAVRGGVDDDLDQRARGTT